jgi:hypothetical protein
MCLFSGEIIAEVLVDPPASVPVPLLTSVADAIGEDVIAQEALLSFIPVLSQRRSCSERCRPWTDLRNVPRATCPYLQVFGPQRAWTRWLVHHPGSAELTCFRRSW